jgi:hypothetical protein
VISVTKLEPPSSTPTPLLRSFRALNACLACARVEEPSSHNSILPTSWSIEFTEAARTQKSSRWVERPKKRSDPLLDIVDRLRRVTIISLVIAAIVI